MRLIILISFLSVCFPITFSKTFSESERCLTEILYPLSESDKNKLIKQRKHVRDNISSILPKVKSSFQDGGEIPEILIVPVVFHNVYQNTEYDGDGNGIGDPIGSYCDWVSGTAYYNYQYTTDNDPDICKERIDENIRVLNIVFGAAGLEFELMEGYEQTQNHSELGYNCICENIAKVDDNYGEFVAGEIIPGCCEPWFVSNNAIISNRYNVEGALNVYMMRELLRPGNGGFANGFGFFGKHGMFSAEDYNDALIHHELGHVFSLKHINGTWYNYAGNTPRDLVDGSDCDIHGDLICDTIAEPGLTVNKSNSADLEYSTKAWYEGSTECVYTGYGGEYDPSTGILKIGGAQSHAGMNYGEYDYCELWGFVDPYGLDNCGNYTNYDNVGDFFGTKDLPENCFNEDVSEYATDGCDVSLYPNLPTGYNIMRSGDIYGACSGLGWDPSVNPFTVEQYANIRYNAETEWPQIQEYNNFIQNYGCTDAEACNYNPDAYANDGSCDYCSCTESPIQILDCIISYGEFAGDVQPNYNWSCPTNGDNSLDANHCTALYCDGIPCVTQCEFNGDGGECGSYNPNDEWEWGICTSTCIDSYEILGCTDDTACNYDESATADDNSCTYAEENYDCDGNCTVLDECGVCGGEGSDDNNCCPDGFSPEGVQMDCCGGCALLWICDQCCAVVWSASYNSSCSGCTDPTAMNYDSTATIDDGSCELSMNELIIPDHYSIHSIYPNPFNPITNITYGLPEHVNVQIMVYDLSGKQVETLINEFQTPGYHSVNWNADNLPSGVFLIRMDSGDFTQTQKVVLVK